MAKASENIDVVEEVTELSELDQMKALMEQAKQEAAAIIAAAKAEAEAISQPRIGGTVCANATNDKMEELVEVRLFKDGGKYKDDVFVAVNGEGCLIRRGETVKIKRKFAEVLEQGMTQDERAAEMQSRYSSEFAAETRARGL